jgi:hypothetical protein
MKKIIMVLIGMLLLAYFFIVQRVSVNAGEEATLTKKPWFYGEKGINLTPLSAQTIWSVQSTDIDITSVQPFVLNEHFLQLLTADDIPIDIDIHFTFQHIKGKTPELIQNFGKDQAWYVNNLKEPLKNTIEKFIKKQSYQKITGDENTSIELQEHITYGVNDFLHSNQIPTNLLDVRVGAINIPKSILDIALTNEEERQKLQTQIIRKDIEKASAEADKTYMDKMNISIKDYIKLKQLELKKKELENQRYAIECAKENNRSIQISMGMGNSK